MCILQRFGSYFVWISLLSDLGLCYPHEKTKETKSSLESYYGYELSLWSHMLCCRFCHVLPVFNKSLISLGIYPYLAESEFVISCKQCKSRSNGINRNCLVRIYIVCHSSCEFVAISLSGNLIGC